MRSRNLRDELLHLRQPVETRENMRTAPDEIHLHFLQTNTDGIQEGFEFVFAKSDVEHDGWLLTWQLEHERTGRRQVGQSEFFLTRQMGEHEATRGAIVEAHIE